MTVKAVCDNYGIGRTYCYKLLSEGQISAVKLGGKTLITASSIDKYFSSLPAYEPGNVA
ncbi:excisionase family DNA-binding protein [Acetobacter musti]|uniref:Excisionase family DNA-binding protein n=2 Tax=Acetobacter musti TaxID=864732 RepID=A0ABX0JQ88_9PROT|nr:excisionase family DNA-binding protein [Acetobacter musti]NHN85586.1 excisionase family DNA-binding protein [Acetobacter musti]